jgi:hypothetical protein
MGPERVPPGGKRLGSMNELLDQQSDNEFRREVHIEKIPLLVGGFFRWITDLSVLNFNSICHRSRYSSSTLSGDISEGRFVTAIT